YHCLQTLAARCLLRHDWRRMRFLQGRSATMPRHVPVSERSGGRGKAVRVQGDARRQSRLDPEYSACEPAGSGRTLSNADAAFLYLERKEMPLAIACLTIFDGPIPFNEFVAKI